MPVIPAFGRLRKVYKVKASLGYIARLCLKKKKRKKDHIVCEQK
jgi:hypothetical protein